jgi:eukaryotic-like serine/threonine-protein kinase
VNKISRYDILRTIAEVDTGQVLLAFDPVIERQVAIKTLDRAGLPAEDTVRTTGRFKREAIAAGRLTHPHIVTVHEYGESGPLCFIVMEYAPGPTLRQHLAKDPTPSPGTLRAIARQLFSAMVYAHEQGVLHRDLKPGNVILAGDAADAASLRAKILDFGIARVDAALGLTLRGRVVGTPGYMAPEQYRGDAVDGRADIYALGVVLFEMLAGRRPFLGTLGEVVRQAADHEAPRVGSIRPGLPAGLDDVIARALQRDPADRYATMREFQEAFAQVLAPAAELPPPVAVAAVAAAAGEPPTITVELPRPPLARPGLPAAAQLTAAVQGLRLVAPAPSGAVARRPLVLFLDDEERILSTLSALFRQAYDVVLSSDGEEALRIVKERRPHVVVSDQRMPKMVGVDFLRQARELDPSSVRILLTGYSDLAAIVGSINDGEVFRFVNKPWNNQEFKDTVAQAAEIALATRQACAIPPPSAEATEVRRAPEAILVAQRSRELFAIVNEGFGRTRPVCYAADLSAVLRTIEDQEVAVLVCDLDGFEGAEMMLKMLKQSRPEIQAVALAATSDSESLVSLINQAQIFRFMSRPLRLGLLDRALRSALCVHANYKAKPLLQQRQSVQRRPAVADSSVGRQILQRLGLLAKPRAAAQP